MFFSHKFLQHSSKPSRFLQNSDKRTGPKKDVARVFGIPADGKSIFSKTAKHYSGNVTSQLAAGHINVKQLRSIKAAQAIVVRDHDGPMSLINQDEFSIRC